MPNDKQRRAEGTTRLTQVAIYARVSTNDGRQDTENQLQQLREYVERQPAWQLDGEFIDNASGSNGNRPALKAMFQAASLREFDLLLFWSLDRLTREGTLPTLNYLQRLTSHGVEWKSFTEQWFDSAGPFREAIISIMATLAKLERTKISERTLAGLARARREGKALGRPRKVWDRDKALELRRAGWTYKEIAQKMRVHERTIIRLVRARSTADAAPRPAPR